MDSPYRDRIRLFHSYSKAGIGRCWPIVLKNVDQAVKNSIQKWLPCTTEFSYMPAACTPMSKLCHEGDNVFSDAPSIATPRNGASEASRPGSQRLSCICIQLTKETIMNSNKSTANPSNQSNQTGKSSDQQSDNMQKGNQQSGNQQSGSQQGAGKQGGTHEQHVEAGRQSHKNDASRGGSSQQSGNAQGNQQSDRSQGNQQSASGSGSSSGSRGGTHEQHVEAGRQSHKNDNKR